MKALKKETGIWNAFGNILGFLVLTACALGLVAIVVWLWRIIFRI